jgi:SEC-C motif-containing protein
MPATATPCPCGQRNARGQPLALADCCGRYLDRGDTAPDAEHLMRSRYSAFVLQRPAYLLATWHPGTRPGDLALEPATQWLGLTVRQHRCTGADSAEVDFVARSRRAGRGGGQAHRLSERSRFVREDGRWFYVDGDLQPTG